MKPFGTFISLLVVISATFTLIYTIRDYGRIGALEQQVKSLKAERPLSEAEMIKESRCSYLVSPTPSLTLAATEDFIVEGVYTVAILKSSGGEKTFECRMTSSVVPGETIWWDQMSGKNTLYRGARNDVVTKLWEEWKATTMPAASLPAESVR